MAGLIAMTDPAPTAPMDLQAIAKSVAADIAKMKAAPQIRTAIRAILTLDIEPTIKTDVTAETMAALHAIPVIGPLIAGIGGNGVALAFVKTLDATLEVLCTEATS